LKMVRAGLSEWGGRGGDLDGVGRSLLAQEFVVENFGFCIGAEHLQRERSLQTRMPQKPWVVLKCDRGSADGADGVGVRDDPMRRSLHST